MNKSEPYDFIEAWSNPGEFAGWFDISIKPPTGIHILIYIKEWGYAIGRLSNDEHVFICTLPHPDSEQFLQVPIYQITHWAVIPTIRKNVQPQTKGMK